MMIDYARRITIPVDEVSGGAVIFNSSRSYAIGLQHLNDTPALSITAKAYTNRASSNDNIVSSHDSTTGTDQWVSLRFDVSGVWGGGSRVIKAAMVNAGDGGTESTNELYEVGVPITLTSRFEQGDSNVGLFANGVNVAGETRISIPADRKIAFSSSQMRLGVGPQTALLGGIFFVLVHSRKLTEGEIQSLHSNPYQILEPA